MRTGAEIGIEIESVVGCGGTDATCGKGWLATAPANSMASKTDVAPVNAPQRFYRVECCKWCPIML